MATQPHAAPRVATLPLPQFWEFQAPAAWQAIDFVSDLHLQAGHPRTFAAFREHLRETTADAVLILGDLFEAWVGDDARHIGFEAEVAELLADTSARRSVAFMAGNRDFLVGADLLQQCGVVALTDPTVLLAFGQRVLLTHGDWLCQEDTDYQRFRAQVRTEHWRKEFLDQPLADRHAIAARMRMASKAHQAEQHSDLWADVDVGTTVQWMHEAGTQQLIHGHTHRPGTQTLAPGFVRHVLTDWELDDPQVPPRAGVLRLSAAGMERLPPAGSQRSPP